MTGFVSLATGAAIAAKFGAKVSIGWLITFHVLNSIGFANIFLVSLALYARVAPAALSATIIGIYYLAFFCREQPRGHDWRPFRKNASHTILAFAFGIMRQCRHHLPPRRPFLRLSVGADR